MIAAGSICETRAPYDAQYMMTSRNTYISLILSHYRVAQRQNKTMVISLFSFSITLKVFASFPVQNAVPIFNFSPQSSP